MNRYRKWERERNIEVVIRRLNGFDSEKILVFFDERTKDRFSVGTNYKSFQSHDDKFVTWACSHREPNVNNICVGQICMDDTKVFFVSLIEEGTSDRFIRLTRFN